jgi:hypothetical protein
MKPSENPGNGAHIERSGLTHTKNIISRQRVQHNDNLMNNMLWETININNNDNNNNDST